MSAGSSSSTARKASPTLFARIHQVRTTIVKTFGWKVLIGTPTLAGAGWSTYYYLYYYRPAQMMRARRQIPDVPPKRLTKMFVTGGENGTCRLDGDADADEASNGGGSSSSSSGAKGKSNLVVVDPLLATHSKVPELEDPRREVGLIDTHSTASKLRFRIAMFVRALQVILRASPVITLFIASYLGLVEFQKACDHLHDLLCSLGPSFIKLGQWMATRPDLFPREVCETLSLLYDTAPAHSWEDTLKILSNTFVHEPLGSAMIAANKRSHRSNSGVQQILEKEHRDCEAAEKAEKESNDKKKSHQGVNAVDTATSLKATNSGSHQTVDVSSSSSSSSTAAAAAVETDTEISILEAFSDIDKVPINSGSVAQVYRATLGREMGPLKKGDEVAIKVLHPNVREIIWIDVCVLKFVCEVITSLIPAGRFLDPMVHWYEFSSFLVSQLNLNREADNLDQFRYNFRNFPLIEFPIPVRPLSSPDVLVESFERGYPLKKTPRVSRAMADRGVHIFLKMLFQDNFVHGDLHPGNIFLRKRNLDDTLDPIHMTPDGKDYLMPDPTTLNELVILDPGLVTSLSPKDRENFILLFSSVACGDSELASKLMVERSPSQNCKDFEAFKSDMAKVFAIVTPPSDQNKDLESKGQKAFRLSEVKIGDVLMGTLMTLRKHAVTIDGNFATLVMSVIVGEGMGRAMNPDYNIFAAAAPFLAWSLKGSELQQLVTQLQAKYGIAVVADLVPPIHFS